MVKIAIVIPSYIKAENPQDVNESDGFRLLHRALASLNCLKGKDVTLVFPFCIEGKMMTEGRYLEYHLEIMKSLSYPFPFNRFILTAHNFRIIKECILKNGFYEIAEWLNLCGFANIRNSGLLISQALGAEVVVFIDNDEVVENTDFLEIALEGLIESMDNKKMDGKGGFYISARGAIYETLPWQWWQLFWNKAKLFKAVWEAILDSKGRFVESPVVLGGNLVLTKRLFENIPFDPLIPRGEDIDYLINAKVAGFEMLFDKHLMIKHLPIERNVSYRKEELKGDIGRFLYERAKVKGYKGLNLDPYPGYFLKWDLKIKALITLILFSLYLASKFRWKDIAEVRACLGSLTRHAKDKEFYNGFKQRWKALMEFVEQDRLKDVVREGFL
ncbi:MAG: hypothetical protein AAB014_01830 [Nitrospirota bacterium]